MEIVKCNEADYEILAGIWERSVMATHSFLRVEDFNEIKKVLIPEYFPNVNLYAISDNGVYAGFIGMGPDSIEMLFIDSDRRGQGYGSALNFYKAKGFCIISRDETDDVGRPYPILHLAL